MRASRRQSCEPRPSLKNGLSMSENIDLHFLGEKMQQMQSDLRQVRAEQLRQQGEQIHVQDRLSRVEEKVDRLDAKVDHLDAKVENGLKAVNARIDQVSEMLATNTQVLLEAIK